MSQELNSTVGTFTPDNLIAGENVPILTKVVTILKGAKLVRGSVLGIITESGKGQLAAKTADDGSQTAKFILAEDVDTTADDVDAVCYQSGLFNRKALTFAADNTAADHEANLRDCGIFLKENIAY